MSVDLSVSHVVGVVLDLDGIKALPNYELYGIDETIMIMLEDKGWDAKGIVYGVAGNYWTGKPEERPWIGLGRLTKSFDIYHIPGGIISSGTLPEPNITEKEGKALRKAAKKLGTSKPKVEQFMSVLWH